MQFLKSLLGLKSSPQQTELDNLKEDIKSVADTIGRYFEATQQDIIEVLSDECDDSYTEEDKQRDAQFFKGERSGYSLAMQLMLVFFPETHDVIMPYIERVGSTLPNINELNAENLDQVDEKDFPLSSAANEQYNIEQILQRVKIIIGSILSINPEEVRPQDTLDTDLGFDAFDMQELLLHLEMELHISIPEVTVHTVQDVANLTLQVVSKQTTYNPKPPAPAPTPEQTSPYAPN